MRWFSLFVLHDLRCGCISRSRTTLTFLFRNLKTGTRHKHHLPILKYTVLAHYQQWHLTQSLQSRWKTTAAIEDIYQKKTQVEHILLRPDTYIGSVEPEYKSMWVLTEDGKQMKQKEVMYVPGLYKIFDEILVNAADNKINDSQMSCIQIDINQSNNRIRVWNDGRGIPVVEHKKYKVYVPSLIFGHLLTSSNYDDTDKRITGGRHGFGAKLCNIFSQKFIVETSSQNEGLKFQQTWTGNMTNEMKPVITETTGKDYTCVTFYPDLAKFGVETINDDMLAVFKRRAFDVAAVTKGIKVVFNGETIPITSFKDYVDMYLGPETPVVHQVINRHWEVAVAYGSTGFNQTSFVNSIYMEKGGTHVRFFTDQLVQGLTPVIQRKANSSTPVKPSLIKNNLWVFINCLIENPAFDSQTKEMLTLKSIHFGSVCDIDKGLINEMDKVGLIDMMVKSQTRARIKSADVGNMRLAGIEKLEDAVHAGTRRSGECTLIITEGDSAKATALAGLSVYGREFFGVYPVSGKLLNVRNKKMDQTLQNPVLSKLMKALGLQFRQTYSSKPSRNTLRYGKIMILADQDEDGSHIKGLIINFIHWFWPSLLESGYISELRTPLVKVSKRNKVQSFYSQQEFKEWKESTANWPSWSIKYYKGLGTSTSNEAKKYFRDIDRLRVNYLYQGKPDDNSIDLVFGDVVEKRKDWITKHGEKGAYAIEDLQGVTNTKDGIKGITYSDFINHEMIHYSLLSIVRAIPCMVDGLKPSQRMVLYTCFEKKYWRQEQKVAQVAAAVTSSTSYHHDEISLMNTIKLLAQNFVGSNNINLLLPVGQFGTRLTGGNDAASARYIFTKLSPIAQVIFNPKDSLFLEHSSFSNEQTQPLCYYPIIPMVLVNGTEGIATGWLSKIFNYDPRDIVANLFRMMDGEKPKHIIPSYKNFQGRIEELSTNRYKVSGCVEVVGKAMVTVTELPVGTWTQDYKQTLIKMIDAKKIRMFSENHTDVTVKFNIRIAPEVLEKKQKKGTLLKYLKLEKVITSFMTLLDEKGALKTYSNVCEIFEEFFRLRWQMYERRKAYMEEMISAELAYLDNQARFINDKLKGKLIIENRKADEVKEDLQKLGYSSDPMVEWNAKQNMVKGHQMTGLEESMYTNRNMADDANSEEETMQTLNYSYLLEMPLNSLTLERNKKLVKTVKAKKQELSTLRKQSIKDMWTADLNEFLDLLSKEEKASKQD